MNIKLNHIFLTTHGDTDIVDITPQVDDFVRSSKIINGLVTVFCPSSTSGITTIEYESGVIEDLKKTFNDLVPKDLNYQHDEAWHDGNGYSHVRAALLKTSLVVPVADSRLMLGTWQQIVYIDFDNRPRKREIIVQIIGE
jgi:secondary thiamine-phosphate synthase enzyme